MVQRSEIYWMMKEGPIIKCFANEELLTEFLGVFETIDFAHSWF